MSWNGFKKKINRVGTMLKQTTGIIGKTDDKVFNHEEKKYKIYEKKVTNLCEQTKEYLDSIRALTAQENRIAEELDSLYDETNDMALSSMNFRNATKTINENIRNAADNEYRLTVLDPINKLGVNFPTVNSLISKRENKLLDYDECRSKVDKLVDKPSRDPTHLPKAEEKLNRAKEVYDNINQELINYFPKAMSIRVPYIAPSLEALILCQLSFSEKAFNTLNDIQNKFRIAGADLADLDAINYKADNALEELKKLGICNFQ